MQELLNDNSFIKASTTVFNSYVQNYFVIIDTSENSLFCFSKDMEIIWNDFKEGVFLSDLSKKYSSTEEDNNKFKNSLILLIELGIITVDDIIYKNHELIAKKNQLDELIVNCGGKGERCKLLIETTSVCNLKCIHCFQDIDINTLKTDKLLESLQEAKYEGYIYITLSGGELFATNIWRDVIAGVRKIGFVYSIISNLTLLNDEDMSFLVSQKPERIKTSIYGNNAKTHDAITGQEGAFNKTIQNIKKLINVGIRVDVNYVIMKDNFIEYEESKKMLENLGCNVEGSYKLYPTRKNRIEHLSHQIARDQLHYLFERGLLNVKGGRCTAGQYELRVSPTGEVFPCAFMNISLGNIYKDNFKKINQSEKLQALVHEIKNCIPTQCGLCRNKDFCTYCPALVWDNKSHINECNTILHNFSNFT